MNQCSRTFILAGLVVAILLALHLMPTLTLGGVELRHVNVLSDVLPEAYRSEEAIDYIPSPEPPAPQVAFVADSSAVEIKETRPPGVTMIDDYSAGAPGGMAHFYSALANVSAMERPVRIAYYGDSFIEGDILTCDLRESLQNEFGGNGVGWVDCGSKVAGFRRTVKHQFSGFTEYEVVKKPYSHSHEGISQRYFVPAEGASFSVKGTGYRRHSASWQVASLFFRTDSSLTVTTAANGSPGRDIAVGASPSVQRLVTTDSMRQVTYTFGGIKGHTYIYGAALESRRGVILDNFSMRGSAGYTLASLPQATLRDFARLRPYDLIVLHFGLNVLSDKSHAANYKAYVKRMKKAVDNLRKAFPEASILIVSIPDRDQRTAAGIRTMNGVESLAAYQKVLASECGVAYFNLFEAMGGRESMKDMVDKGWANKDYTHLSFAGGRHVAGLIYKSLKAGFDNYKLRNEAR